MLCGTMLSWLLIVIVTLLPEGATSVAGENFRLCAFTNSDCAPIAGRGVAVGGGGGGGVAVGGTGVAVGGTGVAVGGSGVAVGGSGVEVGGSGVFVGAVVAVAVARDASFVGVAVASVPPTVVRVVDGSAVALPAVAEGTADSDAPPHATPSTINKAATKRPATLKGGFLQQSQKAETQLRSDYQESWP